MHPRAAVLTLLVAACAHPHPTPNAAPSIPITVDALAADSIAHDMVQRAVDADAKGIVPDSLYIDDAEIIANGLPRVDPPRLAGVGANGEIQLGSSRFAVTGSYVWGTMQYRWVPRAADRKMVAGWATFVIARVRSGEWRIVHVHSSTAAPDST